ncbi:helix-turn-helix domain-containing protein [Microbacterium candidum]|uniref:Helix-turn-helix domain-containing protein n=1 Tax=Microbacterium candidum TaxID=3041922 RepID=A0ABT7MWD2_9MICO|nr:helix-turn-helix domain-containing protein [Microbacterium sp. ASV49]MDL9978753.1 helix-turn-helix domain-containing protein [Microbacterium sp. ASV49]
MSSGEGLPDFLSVGETARLLGVHENTVRNWVKSGALLTARLPGAKQHRFAREEVMRLLRERGESASSVGPQLRTDGPELVTAVELHAWAARTDAKTVFPELMRRLLANTPGVTNIRIRTGEGVAAPGWDGEATSTGSSFLPAGELRFEFGTDANTKGKAQKDYDKRLAEPTRSNEVFVFCTPRNWANSATWAADRKSEGEFAGVVTIDAQVLEGWLRAVPSVHYWISERLGYRPQDARSPERWWDSFVGRVTLDIPPAFFLAGRLKQADELTAALTAAEGMGSSIAVRAGWSDDALAFVIAAMTPSLTLASRAVVVTAVEAWHRLVDSAEPLVLIPLIKEIPDLKVAFDRGHRVVLIADSGDVVRRERAIELPKLDRVVAAEVLKDLSVDSHEAERIVALARRSMPALFRYLARDSRLQMPEWARDTDKTSILSPLALVGSWDAREGDSSIIEMMTGSSIERVERLLRSLADRPEAPFVKSGGRWRLADPQEAAYVLFRDLSEADFARWQDAIMRVLLDEDPFAGMDAVARVTASATGAAPMYSDTLKKHLALGLALAGAASDDVPPELHMQARVNRVVRALFERAREEKSGAVWATIAPSLPSLAEAAPEIFEDAIQDDLEQPNPLLRTLFTDETDRGLFGSSSPHPNLLWALESLTWSPEHFGRATDLLASLAAIDPGGRLSNRPIESLERAVLGWIPNSGGSVEDKIAVIERTLQRVPDVGWKVILGVWPSRHSTAFEPHRPTFRDWAPVRSNITYAEWGRYIHGLVVLAVEAAGERADRWVELIPGLDNLAKPDREQVLASLRARISGAGWREDERYGLWESLTAEADRHEEYSDADWAMPAEDVALYRDVAAELAPTTDPRRYSKLFSWRGVVPGKKRGDEGFDEDLLALQRAAVTEVLAEGMAAIEELVLDVDTPTVVGLRLAELPSVGDDAILRWLSSSESKLREAALSFVSYRLQNIGGVERMVAMLASEEVNDPEARDRLMGAIPATKQYWEAVAELGGDLESAYWRRVAHYRVATEDRVDGVRLLLQHGRPWAAAGLLCDMVMQQLEPAVEQLKSTLTALITGSSPIDDPSMSSFYVGTLLEYMEHELPDDEDLPRYEFAFFDLLHDHKPSRALYRLLCADPNEFVDLVSRVYRAGNEPKRALSPRDQAMGHLAWSVLREWDVLPGLREDGTVDEAHLTDWVRQARLALSDSGRGPVGDEQIGQVLASSPTGSDGVWPVEAVRELVESIGNARVDTGLQIGKTNKRGITTRGVYDGGDQERELEEHYRQMASKIASQWPRTARVLRGIAESYQAEARRHDADAEWRGDDG